MVAVSFVISDGEFPAFYAFGSLDSADGSAVGKEQMQVKPVSFPPLAFQPPLKTVKYSPNEYVTHVEI